MTWKAVLAMFRTPSVVERRMRPLLEKPNEEFLLASSANQQGVLATRERRETLCGWKSRRITRPLPLKTGRPEPGGSGGTNINQTEAGNGG